MGVNNFTPIPSIVARDVFEQICLAFLVAPLLREECRRGLGLFPRQIV